MAREINLCPCICIYNMLQPSYQTFSLQCNGGRGARGRTGVFEGLTLIYSQGFKFHLISGWPNISNATDTESKLSPNGQGSKNHSAAVQSSYCTVSLQDLWNYRLTNMLLKIYKWVPILLTLLTVLSEKRRYSGSKLFFTQLSWKRINSIETS